MEWNVLFNGVPVIFIIFPIFNIKPTFSLSTNFRETIVYVQIQGNKTVFKIPCLIGNSKFYYRC